VNVDDLPFSSVTQLGSLLRRREISSTELTQLYFERLDTIGRHLNAVVTLTEEVAMAEAALADSEILRGLDRGPLHGIPYGLKDIVSVAGVATSWGAEPFRDRVLPHDATVVRRLRNAGAVHVAKLATIEFAGGMGYDHPEATFTGATANPWDVSTWAGGSSTGPSAAVAAGIVPFAIGSDTSGSILLPAAWTGTAGLRATYGRVSRFGAMTLCWTLDRLGPICRTAEDCGLVLEAISGVDPQDTSTLKATYRYQPQRPKGGFRIGAIAGAAKGVEPAIAANYERSLALLSTIGHVEEVALPEFPYDAVIDVISAAEAFAAFDDFLASGRTMELAAHKARSHRLAGALLPAHDYIRAQRIRRHIATSVNHLLSGFDAVVAPTIGAFAAGIDENFEYMLPGAFPQPINYAGVLTGSPTVSIASGFSNNGLPTSIQFAGARLAENSVLSAASALEDLLGLQSRRPPTEAAHHATTDGNVRKA
jgi:aspartyl-tRNA(Asn)/glutamyl-tRNA(Gln) amidotransferase subunit A